MKLPLTESPEAGIGNTSAHLPAVDSSSTFTKAHVFGVFLTLSLCLLAQPIGSLLYRKPKSAFGRAVFFFWRLNPLACAAETFLVLYLVACMFLDAIAETVDQPTHPIGLSHRVHVTAAAIATHRGHSYLPDHWVVRVQSGRAKDDQEPGNKVASTSSPSKSYSQATQTESQATQTEKSDHEAQCPVSQETPTSNKDQTADDAEISRLNFDRKVLNRTLPAHAELAIDLVATICIAFVTLAVFTAIIPTWIRVVAMCMVSNWAAMQLLVVLSHRRNLEAVDPTTLVQHVIRVKARMNRLAVWIVLVTIPSLTYFSIIYAGARRGDLTAKFKDVARNQDLCMYFMFPEFWKLLFRTFSCFRRKKSDVPAAVVEKTPETSDDKANSISWKLLGAIGLVITIVVLLSILWANYLFKALKTCVGCPECTSQCVPASIWAGLHCWFWFILPMCANEREWRRVVCAVWSLLATAYIFSGAMVLYDAEATEKPEWLQWLGGPSWMTAG